MVKRVGSFFRKYGLIVALAITVLFAFFLNHHLHEDLSAEFDTFQSRFVSMQAELKTFTREADDVLNKEGEQGLLNTYEEAGNEGFFLHVYRNDTLRFWNTNYLPVYSFAELHFPVEGIVRLQNGWYYSTIVKHGKTRTVGSFLIQHTYPIENAHLRNSFHERLSDFPGTISLDSTSGVLIKDNNDRFLFSIHPPEGHADSPQEETMLFGACLLIVCLIWLQFRRWVKTVWVRVAVVILLGGIRFWLLHLNVFSGFSTSKLFDPTILALGEWTPNLGELVVSFVWFLFAADTLLFAVRQLKEDHLFAKPISGMLFILFPFLSYLMSSIGKEIVENSSIPFHLDQLFSLNEFSLFILLIVGVAGFLYLLLFIEITAAVVRSGWSLKMLAIVWLLSTLAYVLTGWYLDTNWNSIWWPVLLCTPVILRNLRQKPLDLSVVLLLLLIYATGATSSFYTFSQTKERSERELYANQLADDRDINTEIEYQSIKTNLLNEPYLERLSSPRDKPNPSTLKEAMERRIFNGYWERYDIDFYYFPVKDTFLLVNGESRYDFEQLIQRHGEVSEIDPSIFIIKDYTSQFSYLIREKVHTANGDIWLYCTLKSKKIPEEIGFPRLLISDKAKVFESLEKYSIVKYYDGKLVNKYGDYSFPYSADVWKETKGGNKRFFNKDGYNHLMLRRGKSDMIILSREDSSWVDAITSMAFLFVSFGVLLAVYSWFFAKNKRLAFRRLSLAVKIQVVLVGLVFLSLLGFSIGSGTFVKDQYEQYTDDVIREKLRSVSTVGILRLGKFDDINDPSVSGDLEYYLRNWSQIFVTDVNVYDTRGPGIRSFRSKTV